MRIGLVTTSYPQHESDTAGIFVRGFARTLVALGHTVEVLAPEGIAAAQPPMDEGIELVPVPYLRPRSWQTTFYGAGVPDNIAAKPARALSAVPFVANLVRQLRKRGRGWDAVVSHWALPSALVVGRVLESLPHLAVLHGGDVHALRRAPFSARFREEVATHANVLWFVSAELRNLYGETFGTESMVHAMGVDTPRGRDDAARTPRAADAPFRMATMSRLVELKGIDVALSAAKRLHHVSLSIAGDGPLRASLAASIDSASAVRLVGSVYGSAKEDFFRNADVFVVPSRATAGGREEGAPTTILEAMLRGIPVIGTRSGGIPEMITDGETGLLVPPNDAAALADAVERLRSDSALREAIVKNARSFAERFTWPAMKPVVEHALMRACARPATTG